MKPLRDLFLGFVKLHILHHAGHEPVFGLWLMEELAQHGYRLSPGTLYPILHSLEQDGLLSSTSQVVDGKVRKYYQLTPAGQDALAQGREKAAELLRELGPQINAD
jgi:DNA-binding PadR family transcriptional regulator